MSRRTIWRSAEICRDHRVCRARRWRESLVELRRQVHVATDEPRKDEFLAKICMSGWQVSLQRVCHPQLGRRRHKSKMPRNARLTPDLSRGRAMPTGMDTSKHIFQLHVNTAEEPVLRKISLKTVG